MRDDHKHVFKVLIIEDNAGDALLLQDRFDECSAGQDLQCNVRWLANSTDVIRYLRSPEMTSYRPDLFVLDYKMPIDGGPALTELKGDPDYLHVPVVVVTGSRSPADVLDVYRRGANCCYHKPDSLEVFDRLVNLICQHWLKDACHPQLH